MKLLNCLIVAIVLIGLIIYSKVFKNKIKEYKVANKFFVLGVITFTIFAEFAINYISIKPLFLDTIVYEHISKTITEQTTEIMLKISQFGLQNVMIIFLVLVVSCVVICKKNNIYWQMLIINFCLAVFVNQSLKGIFARPRPEILRLEFVGGYSFPSGHATISMCFYGYIIYLILTLIKSRSKYLLAGLFTLLVAAIGYSRVYLGSHYTSDVLGGFLCGLGVTFISCAVTEYLYKKNKTLVFNILILILGVCTSMQNLNTIKLYFKILLIALAIQVVLYIAIKCSLKLKNISNIIYKLKNVKNENILTIIRCIPLVRLFIPYIESKKEVKLIDFLKSNLTIEYIYVFLFVWLSGIIQDIHFYFSDNFLVLICIVSMPLIIYYFTIIRGNKNNVKC